MTIDTFDHVAGWGTDNDMVPKDFDNLDKWLAETGFDQFCYLGEASVYSIEVFHRKDEFFVSIDTHSQWRIIHCANLPSCIGLLAQLEPWFRMAQGTELIDMVREFHELLIEYGQDGPLEMCLARKRRAEEYRQRRRKELAVK